MSIVYYIRMAPPLAQQTKDRDLRSEYLGILEDSSRILMDLVNNIMDMSRIESGQLNMELLPFNLPEMPRIP